jgi:hypothetical protein
MSGNNVLNLPCVTTTQTTVTVPPAIVRTLSQHAQLLQLLPRTCASPCLVCYYYYITGQARLLLYRGPGAIVTAPRVPS